jgi:hypothetical protein
MAAFEIVSSQSGGQPMNVSGRSAWQRKLHRQTALRLPGQSGQAKYGMLRASQS